MMSYCRSQIIYVQTIDSLRFRNKISRFGSKILVIFYMKIIVIIKIEANYLHTAYLYGILETFIPIDNNA